MKRLAFCLALLCCPGCMLPDDYLYEDTIWYDAPVGGCEVVQPGFAPPQGRLAPTPQVVPLGPNIIPAGATVPAPPAAPQTREPELLKR